MRKTEYMRESRRWKVVDYLWGMRHYMLSSGRVNIEPRWIYPVLSHLIDNMEIDRPTEGLHMKYPLKHPPELDREEPSLIPCSAAVDVLPWSLDSKYQPPLLSHVEVSIQ